LYPNKGVTMPFLKGPKYVRWILPTLRKARDVKILTLQDVEAGKFRNPRAIADPSNPEEVRDQRLKMLRHPWRYSGYVYDGRVVAYLVENWWIDSDKESRETGELGGLWGITGLVASDRLRNDVRERILTDLLRRAVLRARKINARTVVVFIHDYDPLLNIARNYGFVAVGEKAEVSGAPGLKQQRYELRIA
jgi:hypothetical protein